jgi:hypothetical protein
VIYRLIPARDQEDSRGAAPPEAERKKSNTDPEGVAPSTSSNYSIAKAVNSGEYTVAQTLVNVLVHVIFSTKERRHLIKTEVQPELYAYMAGTLKNLDSPCLALGGTSNHVHLLTALSKKSALSDVVGELKKSSSK